jgi:hypothetical protein
MTSKTIDSLTAFSWSPQPEAEALVHQLVNDFVEHCELAATLRDRLYRAASVRFVDMVDHLGLPMDTNVETALIAAGYDQQTVTTDDAVYVQDKGIFPRILLSSTKKRQLTLKVDSVADFESIWQTGSTIVGSPLAAIRWANVWSGNNAELWIVERHGYSGFEHQTTSPSHLTIRRRNSEPRRSISPSAANTCRRQML